MNQKTKLQSLLAEATQVAAMTEAQYMATYGDLKAETLARRYSKGWYKYVPIQNVTIFYLISGITTHGHIAFLNSYGSFAVKTGLDGKLHDLLSYAFNGTTQVSTHHISNPTSMLQPLSVVEIASFKEYLNNQLEPSELEQFMKFI